QGRPVAGARVTLLASNGDVVAVRTTTADGKAEFGSLTAERVDILAPGFAEVSQRVQSGDNSIALRVATASETVIVTANDTPLPIEQGASPGSLLTGDQLTAMQPVNAAEALRFLP